MKAVPSLIKQHKPKNEEIWYHYCSADSFMAITKNKTLRFCDLRHMNDITELSHGEKLLDEMLDNIVLSIELRTVIRTVLDFFRNRTLLLSMSFSENEDQLSQWRGYADDGNGFCVGFRAKDLNTLPSHLLKVEYNIDKQKQLIENAIRKITKQLATGFDFKSALWIVELFELFSMMKNKSFKEESEFRLVRAIFVDAENGGRLYDISKQDNTYKDGIKDIDFRLDRMVPTPFVDVDYSAQNTINPIKRVIIGPKNKSRIMDIELFLATLGLSNVAIKKSDSSYR